MKWNRKLLDLNDAYVTMNVDCPIFFHFDSNNCNWQHFFSLGIFLLCLHCSYTYFFSSYFLFSFLYCDKGSIWCFYVYITCTHFNMNGHFVCALLLLYVPQCQFSFLIFLISTLSIYNVRLYVCTYTCVHSYMLHICTLRYRSI